MDRINDIASEYGLIVIEDAAQSFGATYKGKNSCNLSHLGCTSFSFKTFRLLWRWWRIIYKR